MPKKISLSVDLLRESRIPQKFWDLGMDTFLGSPTSRSAVEHYLEKVQTSNKVPPGIMFVGAAHSCKTFLATHVLKCLLSFGKNVAYYTTDDLCDLQFQRLDTIETSFRERILSPDFLCIDNVNAPIGRGHKIALLKAVRLRSDEGRPYFICTRFKQQELLAFYGVVTEEDSVSSVSEGDLLQFFEHDLITINCKADPFAIQNFRSQQKKPYSYTIRC